MRWIGDPLKVRCQASLAIRGGRWLEREVELPLVVETHEGKEVIRDGSEMKGVIERKFVDIKWDIDKVQSKSSKVKTSDPLPTTFSLT